MKKPKYINIGAQDKNSAIYMVAYKIFSEILFRTGFDIDGPYTFKEAMRHKERMENNGYSVIGIYKKTFKLVM